MRYARPTHQFAVGDRVVTRIAEEWARCAADLAARGASFARPADVLAGSTGPASGRRGRHLPGVIFAFCDTAGAANALSYRLPRIGACPVALVRHHRARCQQGASCSSAPEVSGRGNHDRRAEDPGRPAHARKTAEVIVEAATRALRHIQRRRAFELVSA
jgi:hypothetical protein